MNKTKIIYYTDSKLVGGAERFQYLLLKNLNRNIYEPILICPNGVKHQRWRKAVKKLKVKVVPIATRSIFSVAKFYKIYKFFKSQKPKIIHFQFWSPYSCGIGLICAKLTRAPIVFSSEHSFVPLEEAEWYLRPIKRLYHKWRKNIIDYPTTVSLASKEMMEKHQSFINKKIYVIHNGIAPNRKIKKLNLNHQKINLVTTARLEEGKGHVTLINSVNSIEKKKRKKLIFHLIGGGSLEKKLKKQVLKSGIINNFKFWGQRNDVEEILPSFDIFVFPSLSENFPFAILEAMDAGLPIIASDVGGIKEALVDQEGGYLIKVNSQKFLTKAIIKMIQNRYNWKRFGQFNRNLVRSKFNDKVMTRNLEKLYQKALKK